MDHDISPIGSSDNLRETLRKYSTSRHVRARSSVSSGEVLPQSAVTDTSSSSEVSEDDQDYNTDYTTPTSSDIDHHDTCPDEVEVFRDKEYPQLKGKVYLDNGGTAIYAKSLMESFCNDMMTNLYGNPHSACAPAKLSGRRIDAIRIKALAFFNADPDKWDLVFTANATAAIKLVAECMRDHVASSNTPIWYGYHKDAHTSLVGIRELVKMHRCFTTDEEVDIWINSGGLGGPRPRQMGLFAFPGQSNMTGRRLPLSWSGRIRRNIHKAQIFTLLDAAALAATTQIDLSDTDNSPDFVALSFYKIFGFPNIGALLVRKESGHVLESRKYFGGGTVEMVISINDTWHAKKDVSIHDRLEDGTLPFHSIIALDHAIDVHEKLYGPKPMRFISQHTGHLASLVYETLSHLHHANGLAVVRIYKDINVHFKDSMSQGGTIAFNVQRADGTMVGYEDVEAEADVRGIFLRSGSLCNPGGVATYLEWTPAEMRAAYAAGHRCSAPTQTVLGKATGVVRVSIGPYNTLADVQTFLAFITGTYTNLDATIPLPRAVSITATTINENGSVAPSHQARSYSIASQQSSRRASGQALPKQNPPHIETSTLKSISQSSSPSLQQSESKALSPASTTTTSRILRRNQTTKITADTPYSFALERKSFNDRMAAKGLAMQVHMTGVTNTPVLSTSAVSPAMPSPEGINNTIQQLDIVDQEIAESEEERRRNSSLINKIAIPDNIPIPEGEYIHNNNINVNNSSSSSGNNRGQQGQEYLHENGGQSIKSRKGRFGRSLANLVHKR